MIENLSSQSIEMNRALLVLLQNAAWPLDDVQCKQILTLIHTERLATQTVDTLLASSAGTAHLVKSMDNMTEQEIKHVTIAVPFAGRDRASEAVIQAMLRAAARDEKIAEWVLGSVSSDRVSLAVLILASNDLLDRDKADYLTNQAGRKRVVSVLLRVAMLKKAELGTAIDDPRVLLRVPAIWIAGYLGAEAVDLIPRIKDATHDKNDLVARNATKALERIISDVRNNEHK